MKSNQLNGVSHNDSHEMSKFFFFWKFQRKGQNVVCCICDQYFNNLCVEIGLYAHPKLTLHQQVFCLVWAIRILNLSFLQTKRNILANSVIPDEMTPCKQCKDISHGAVSSGSALFSIHFWNFNWRPYLQKMALFKFKYGRLHFVS